MHLFVFEDELLVDNQLPTIDDICSPKDCGSEVAGCMSPIVRNRVYSINMLSEIDVFTGSCTWTNQRAVRGDFVSIIHASYNYDSKVHLKYP